MATKGKPLAVGPRGEREIAGCPQNNLSQAGCQDIDAISVFKGIRPKPTASTTWQQTLKNIRSDKYKKTIKGVRGIFHKFGCSSIEYRKAKINLPAVTFGGTFRAPRNKGNILSPTGFILSDLDHLVNLELIFNLLIQDSNVWFVFRSPSAEGIKAGIRAKGIKTDADHKQLFFAVERYFKEVYGLKIDPACKDISRLTFVSHDPKLWINPGPQHFDIEKWKPISDDTPQPVKAPTFNNTNGKQKYARKVLESCCDEIRQSQPGDQHHTRLKAARLIGGYLQYISESEVIAELEQAVQASGAKNISAAMKTVRDGLAYGKLEPITIEDINRSNATHSGTAQPGQDETQDESTDQDIEFWGTAKKLFPRIDFPKILPGELIDSLAQLAHSIGMSGQSLPGVCMAAVGAAIGDRISVSPKQSWCEPFIFWAFDIRPSGEGKTPAMQALIKLFHRKQKNEHDYYDIRKAEFDKLSAKEKRETPLPARPKGYLSNSLTIEGLKADLEISKTGGHLVALSEASTLISSQNEYKARGTDRESWIALHDGNPVRTLRVKESTYINNSRVQIVGGIQPGVFRRIFNSGDGIFLVDGTVFRGLYTYDGEGVFDIDGESWNEDAESVWTTILERAFAYSDKQESTQRQHLSKEAKSLFFSWRNSLNRQKPFLPEKIRGFVPKAIGYSLRFAGGLHCIHKFHDGLEPTAIITRVDMQRGIDGVMFYLGQAVDVVRLLAGENCVSVEITDQTLHLAKTLESLKPELDSGRLAVGYIQKKFNETCDPEQTIKSARAMGALLRHCKLTIPGGTFNANQRESVKCLQWDEKAKSFIKVCLQSLQCLQNESYQGLQGGDIEKTNVSKVSRGDIHNSQVETLETLKKQCLQAETRASTSKSDIGDIGDVFSKKNKKPDDREFEDLGAGCSDCDEDVL